MSFVHPYHHFTASEPIAPPVIYPAQAQKSVVVIKTQTGKRTCNYCRKHVPREAIKCPFCKEWRKDVKEGFYKLRIAIVVLLICSGLIGLTIAHEWPRQKYYYGHASILFDAKNNYSWHEKIIDKEPKRLTSPSNDIMATMISGVIDDVRGEIRYRWQFSINKFFDSLSGWFVIINTLFITFTWCAYTHISNNLKHKGCRVIF